MMRQGGGILPPSGRVQWERGSVMDLKRDVDAIIAAALHAAMPDTAVRKALERLPACRGRLVLVAAGKAAWQMAQTALAALGSRVDGGIVITKYGHARGCISLRRDIPCRMKTHILPRRRPSIWSNP